MRLHVERFELLYFTHVLGQILFFKYCIFLKDEYIYFATTQPFSFYCFCKAFVRNDALNSVCPPLLLKDTFFETFKFSAVIYVQGSTTLIQTVPKKPF